MPVMDGLTAYEQIKKHDELENLSIIVLSAQNDMNSLAKIKALNVEHHLIKPFRLKELFDKIETITMIGATKRYNV